MPEARRKPSIDQQPVHVGVIGHGNVGRGVVNWFQDGSGKKLGIHLNRVAVSNPTKHREAGLGKLLTGDAAEIIQDPNIQIVVEVMGGVDFARGYAQHAIQQGKSFVTANKALMARFAKELFDSARREKVDVAFEAAVAGGVPIINTINRYRGDKINRVMGVVNGTTNFILTRMAEGMNFDTALKIAQERGFAEANHILDTGGFDARDKFGIFAMLMFNAQVDPETIECHGITDVTPEDIEFAASYGVAEGGPGYSVKLLGIADRKNGAVEVRVNPALVRRDHPLAAVNDEYNAVYLEAELAGPQWFGGRGAGTDATTGAVVSDIVHVAENIQRGVSDTLPTLDEEVVFVAPDEIVQRGYIRVDLKHEPGSLETAAGILGKNRLNIEDSIQRRGHAKNVGGDVFVPDIITVEPAKGSVLRAALKDLESSDRVHGKPLFMNIVG